MLLINCSNEIKSSHIGRRTINSSVFRKRQHPFFSSFTYRFNGTCIVNGGWHFERVFVANLSDCSSQDFPASCFGQRCHENAANHCGEGADFRSYFAVDLDFELLDRIFIHSFYTLAFQDDVGQGTFSFERIVIANNSTFYSLVMIVDYFLESSCRNSMTCCVYDVIYSGHNVEVAVLIEHSSVTSSVVARGLAEIFLNKGMVVTPKSEHEGWR